MPSSLFGNTSSKDKEKLSQRPSRGLDQFFTFRPFLGLARYRGPLAGLYLCGAGTHPGGGVTGAPGANAAREILKDLKTG